MDYRKLAPGLALEDLSIGGPSVAMSKEHDG
jgi:hypothetical protein